MSKNVLIMEDFVSLELGKKLKEKGFDYDTLFAYNDEQIINPKVVEKYGELSDDGYYELTKQGGGELDWDYVYIYQQLLMPQRTIFVKRNYLLAPTISQVLKWLREEKNIYISVFIDDDSDTPVTFEVHKGNECIYTHHGNYFALSDWDKCELKAIEYVLDNVI